MIPQDFGFCICDFETTGVDTENDFPIEVGCIFTDSNFVFRGSYESLICHEHVLGSQTPNGDWPERWQQAFRVHKIPFKEVIGASDAIVVTSVISEIVLDLKKTFGLSRVILVSDNAQFEYRFMKRLFEAGVNKFPFHYCAWDTSLLLELTDVGDPKAEHRAFADASLLYKALIQAMDRISRPGG
jgi:DNA polymerase III epsilon subunit-like protein